MASSAGTASTWGDYWPLSDGVLVGVRGIGVNVAVGGPRGVGVAVGSGGVGVLVGAGPPPEPRGVLVGLGVCVAVVPDGGVDVSGPR